MCVCVAKCLYFVPFMLYRYICSYRVAEIFAEYRRLIPNCVNYVIVYPYFVQISLGNAEQNVSKSV